jgi:hypothetical protein
MSHIPAIVARLAHDACEAAETLRLVLEINVTSLSSYTRPGLMPLNRRPSHELWERAAELRRMAATARTADAKVALEALAARFAALAVQRERAEAWDLNRDDADEN